MPGMEHSLTRLPSASHHHHFPQSPFLPPATSRLFLSCTGLPLPRAGAAAAGAKGIGNSKNSKRDGPSLGPSKGFGKQKNKVLVKEEDEEDDAFSDELVCPCGGGDKKLAYSDCCLPFHQEKLPVPDGLSLLKARFSAYSRGLIGYVVKTTHPDNPDCGDNLPADVHATCERLKFHKLEVMNYEPVNDKESYVSFRVSYGPAHGGKGDRKVMEEKSYFVREDDTWLFRDGEALSQA